METARPLARWRASWVAVTSLGVALGAMAVDHVLGTEREEGESGLVDPTMFVVGALLSLAAALPSSSRARSGRGRLRPPERFSV